jgi:hypothetical protein
MCERSVAQHRECPYGSSISSRYGIIELAWVVNRERRDLGDASPVDLQEAGYYTTRSYLTKY